MDKPIITQDRMPSLEHLRILLVDDLPANNRFLELMLLSKGFTNITTCTDPYQAVRLYTEHPYDLVILDYNMPGMHGLQVLEALKKVEKSCFLPVLMITAQTERQIRLDALSQGVQDFLTKPLDQLEILPRIRNILMVRVLTNQLEEKVRERTTQLEKTQLEIVERLGRASEFRDNETGMHIRRMSRISGILGRGLGMPRDQFTMLENAAPMHDLGKIGVPDHILLKPGKLDAEQIAIMRTHPDIGRGILDDADTTLLILARDIALTHHECWDGSGYPQGLKGEDIPLEGRICAVADVYDALTSERPYKKAWPIEKAVAFLQEKSGSQFDPDVVRVFMERLDEIVKVTKQFAD